jgi:hypothetical protein
MMDSWKGVQEKAQHPLCRNPHDPRYYWVGVFYHLKQNQIAESHGKAPTLALRADQPRNRAQVAFFIIVPVNGVADQ